MSISKHNNLLPLDGEAYYIPCFLTPKKAQYYYDHILETAPWKQEPIKIFGKLINQPRLTAWYGDPHCHYKYSGLLMTPSPWTQQLLDLKKQLESYCHHPFNSALLNLYRHQHDGMGWHTDDEKELGPNPVIASLSLGQTRTFKMKHAGGQEKISLDLEHGSLLLMRGETQHHWKHALPKRSKPLESRLNLTFRLIKTPINPTHQ